MSLTLGIDVGTSSVKAMVLDTETAKCCASAGKEYPMLNPSPGHVEHDPEDWWRAAQSVVQQVRQTVNDQEVAAIGLTGQMHGTLLLDEAHKPLHHAIIWADQRSAVETKTMIDAIGATKYAAITGTLPAAGFMGPALLWLKQHQPTLLDRAYHVILPKDYIRLRLTGEVATDQSDAAATGLFDITEKQWSKTILDQFGLPERIFPPVLESTAVSGKLSAEAAQALGLQAGIPVIAGCADQPAQAVANGLIVTRKASVTIGTGGQVFVPLSIEAGAPVPTDTRLHVFNHAVPGMFYILGATLAAGLCLRWLRNLLGLETSANAYELLSAEAATVSPGSDHLIFLPYLMGERTPHMDPLARGVFFGLSYHHTRAHMARAVMEGVTFALRQALEISLSLSDEVEIIIAAGGGSESAVWLQMQADIFGLPLQKTLLTDQSPVGAAMLAAVGAGIYSSINEVCDSVVRYGKITVPDLNRHHVYSEFYAKFINLYPHLREDFQHLQL